MEADVMDNIAYVKSLYALYTSGKFDKLLTEMTPDIQWISNSDPALLPWGGEKKGIEGARTFFTEVAKNMEMDSFTPMEFYGGKDFVTVIGRSRGRMRKSGARFEDEWMHLFRIRDGKVAYFRSNHDTHAVVQAYYGGDVHMAGLPSGETASLRHH
jgi:uncharacterized protein